MRNRIYRRGRANLSRYVLTVNTNPYVYPGVLLLVGLLALLMVKVRTRIAPARWPRLVVGAYGLLVVAALAAGAGVLVAHGQLFWGVHWDAASHELVLERMLPLSEVRIPRADLASVTEFAAPERTVLGPRMALQFIVQTKSGASYWSAPVYRNAAATNTRSTMIAAGPRIDHLTVGGRGAVLPD